MKTLLISLFTIAATSLGAIAQDAVKLELTGNDQMQFDKKELTVTEGQKVTLTLKHIGKLAKNVMGHNVVILQAGTPVPPFAMKAAPAAATDYIPADEESKKLIVAHTKMVGGGESASVTFTAPAPGDYPYICTFPGHFGLMTGKLVVKAK
ncbi:plastocyanin/azurin family copper-binding protein [Haloferula sp.]|uniref:plastocyanin/azurin family copper-binding protein n=1 Tax=Haloferula sp. TaxID=2497595 RepID=UPI00329FAE72